MYLSSSPQTISSWWRESPVEKIPREISKKNLNQDFGMENEENE